MTVPKILHLNKHEKVEAQLSKALKEHQAGNVTDLFLCYKRKEPNESFRYWFGDSYMILGLLERMKCLVNQYIDDKLDQ